MCKFFLKLRDKRKLNWLISRRILQRHTGPPINNTRRAYCEIHWNCREREFMLLVKLDWCECGRKFACLIWFRCETVDFLSLRSTLDSGFLLHSIDLTGHCGQSDWPYLIHVGVCSCCTCSCWWCMFEERFLSDEVLTLKQISSQYLFCVSQQQSWIDLRMSYIQF